VNRVEDWWTNLPWWLHYPLGICYWLVCIALWLAAILLIIWPFVWVLERA
jgi:hypothetical protein